MDEQRNPRTRATVNQLIDRYLDVIDVEETTQERYAAAIRVHVRPVLGEAPVAKLSGETIDRFHAIPRRCREHCDGRPYTVHALEGRHECSAKYRPHVCKPLSYVLDPQGALLPVRRTVPGRPVAVDHGQPTGLGGASARRDL